MGTGRKKSEEGLLMGEKFYMELDAFRAKYPTKEMRVQVLRQMSPEKILQLSRACASLQEAIWYAGFAQEALDRMECCDESLSVA